MKTSFLPLFFSLAPFVFFKDPPVPEKEGILVSKTTHNSFSVWINASQLDDTNGPITHVGVLVASELPGGFLCTDSAKQCSFNDIH